MYNQPVCLADLDDTLFQTKRKMVRNQAGEAVRTGAVSRDGVPHSFMGAEQSMFVDWLLLNTDLIPVTARGTDEMSRVQIPFKSWRITTHGAVLLGADGEPNQAWKSHIEQVLQPYREKIIDLRTVMLEKMKQRGLDGTVRIVYEYDQVPIYLVIKHKDNSQVSDLHAFGKELEQSLGIDGFYIHQNDNNIAWLPTCVEKGHAVAFLLELLRKERGVFPTLGFGDSVSDLSFLTQCSWFGMPKVGQLPSVLRGTIPNKEERTHG